MIEHPYRTRLRVGDLDGGPDNVIEDIVDTVKSNNAFGDKKDPVQHCIYSRFFQHAFSLSPSDHGIPLRNFLPDMRSSKILRKSWPR